MCAKPSAVIGALGLLAIATAAGHNVVMAGLVDDDRTRVETRAAEAATASLDQDTITILASSDFNDGTLGPFRNPWSAGIDFPDDPTGSGRGKVARIRYAPRSGDSQERAFAYMGRRLRYGSTIWMKGEVYLPSGLGSYDPNHNRKLLDYQGGGVRMTLHRRDGELRVSIVDWMNGAERETIAEGTRIRLSDNQWHGIEVRLTTNSADDRRDGILELFMNGARQPTYRRSAGLGWITEKFRGGSYFDTYLVGFQLTIDAGRPAYEESRYWDNVSFVTARAQP